MPERIVITGMGAITPLALNVDETWKNLLAGVSGVGPITLFDASHLNVKIACEVKGFVPENYLSYRDSRRRDRVQQLTSAAVIEAINQAGLPDMDLDPERVGVIVSSAIGGMETLEDNMRAMIIEGPHRVSPYAIPGLMINASASLIAIDYGFKGPCFSVVSACATGADNLGIAWTLLRSGVIDLAIAGAGEAPITEIGISGFDRLRGASRRNDDYSMTPQPFDKNRDGLVFGEAAAILVLEKESHAKERGVEILAELAGFGSTVDAYHITAPVESGEGGARALRGAMGCARINPEDVDYINAHGTATILNDISETRAIKSAFGELAYNIPVSSTKSMTGHTMGAAGSLEAIFCVKAIRSNIIPPTIHYQTPDKDCDLDYVPNESRELQVGVALSNSFGFGGHNTVIIIKEYNG